MKWACLYYYPLCCIFTTTPTKGWDENAPNALKVGNKGMCHILFILEIEMSMCGFAIFISNYYKAGGERKTLKTLNEERSGVIIQTMASKHCIGIRLMHACKGLNHFTYLHQQQDYYP